MNRRESLKAIGLATAGTVLWDSCQTSGPPKQVSLEVPVLGRQAFEIARDRELESERYFTGHELATIVLLVDLIIPGDERSGSATEARVPDFIEFIVKDEPEHQLPMRGGLRWLDIQCLDRYGQDFIHSTPSQQLELLGDIAFPMQARPEMLPGVMFFNKIRDLTAIGFFTSKMGIADLGYLGNRPNEWKGVPEEVLKRYGLE